MADDQENNINLFAFWRYDRYPYTLGGKASKMRADGAVYVNSYQGWFRPFKLLPISTGEKLYTKLKLLEESHRQAERKVKNEFDKRLFEVMPDHPKAKQDGR